MLDAARDERAFTDLPSFLRPVTLPRTSVENLILIGAMEPTGAFPGGNCGGNLASALPAKVNFPSSSPPTPLSCRAGF